MPDDVPSQFDVMKQVTGTHWAPGEGPSAKIATWLQFISAKYADMSSYCGSAMHLDYFEWCGMTVGFCMAKAGIRPVFGTKDTDKFLWALAWLEWGDAVQTPNPGDVVVLDFGGGHQHVTMFESDAGDGNWNCRGGNQSHEVRASKFPKSCVRGVRRPKAGQIAGAVAGAAEGVGGAIVGLGEAAAGMAAASFVGGGSPLTQPGLDAAAKKLGVGVAEIWALTYVETDPPYGGFYDDKRPQILFERHIFHGLTKGRFDAGYPDISNPVPGGYGSGGSHQYDRLSQAMGLDESAALQSASWGIGQVLGSNYAAAGYGSPQEMVADLFASEDAQLSAVANEIMKDGAAGAFASHDWPAFAKLYNGPDYAENNYDSRLRSSYEKFDGGAPPDLRVRTAQLYLMYLGFHPSDIDGSWGKRTRSAMNEYQAKKGLPVTQSLDDATYSAIEADGKSVKGVGLAANDPSASS